MSISKQHITYKRHKQYLYEEDIYLSLKIIQHYIRVNNLTIGELHEQTQEAKKLKRELLNERKSK